MRRPQTASRLIAVIVGLLVFLVIAAPAAARQPDRATRGPRLALHTADATQLARRAPQARRAKVSGTGKCTGWDSTRTPPPTIRVLRAKKREGVSRQVVGTVQEVPFREYVGVVLAAEWPDHYPVESIKAGALAVKQYAWYYTIVYRGKEVELEDGSMACYDVEDTTNDQVYYPEHWSPSPKHLRAIESSWPLTVRKFRATTSKSTFFLTGYRNGASVACGADVDGWHLFQQSVRRCGLDGRKMRDILRKYLEPQLEIVTLGRHDIIGNEKGDASALVRNDQDELVAHVWTPGAEPPVPGGSRTAQALAIGGLVGALSSDVDGDGHDDLVWMRQTGPEEGRIKVARSNGIDYADAEDWYAGTTKAPLADAFLLSGDFNGDERRDVGLLARAQSGGHASVFVFKGIAGGGFKEPAKWWSGPLDVDRVSAAWAGDVSGDGRADLIIREDPASGGIRLKIALASRTGPGIGELKTRFSDDMLRPSRVRIVPGDADRDGREDLFLVTQSSGAGHVDRLKARPAGVLVRSLLWKATRDDPIDIRSTRLGVADVDYDGLTDLLLFQKDGTGTRIRVLKSRYDSMDVAPSIAAPSMEWETVRPY